MDGYEKFKIKGFIKLEEHGSIDISGKTENAPTYRTEAPVQGNYNHVYEINNGNKIYFRESFNKDHSDLENVSEITNSNLEDIVKTISNITGKDDCLIKKESEDSYTLTLNNRKNQRIFSSEEIANILNLRTSDVIKYLGTSGTKDCLFINTLKDVYNHFYE